MTGRTFSTTTNQSLSPNQNQSLSPRKKRLKRRSRKKKSGILKRTTKTWRQNGPNPVTKTQNPTALFLKRKKWMRSKWMKRRCLLKK